MFKKILKQNKIALSVFINLINSCSFSLLDIYFSALLARLERELEYVTMLTQKTRDGLQLWASSRFTEQLAVKQRFYFIDMTRLESFVFNLSL